MDPTITVALIGGISVVISSGVGVLATGKYRKADQRREKAELEKQRLQRIDTRTEQLITNLEQQIRLLLTENQRLRTRLADERENL